MKLNVSGFDLESFLVIYIKGTRIIKLTVKMYFKLIMSDHFKPSHRVLRKGYFLCFRPEYIIITMCFSFVSNITS